jgi:hypothetical protein
MNLLARDVVHLVPTIQKGERGLSSRRTFHRRVLQAAVPKARHVDAMSAALPPKLGSLLPN